MRHIGSLLVVALAVPVGALAADQVQLTPGRWQETFKVTQMSTNGLDLRGLLKPLEDQPHFACIKPAEARDPRAYFQHDRESDDECTPMQGSVANGVIALKTTCKSRKGFEGPLTIKGSYTSRSYHTTAHSEGTSPGGPVVMNMEVEGRYVGQCKGDEDK